jgi:hypothetical protein
MLCSFDLVKWPATDLVTESDQALDEYSRRVRFGLRLDRFNNPTQKSVVGFRRKSTRALLTLFFVRFADLFDERPENPESAGSQ